MSRSTASSAAVALAVAFLATPAAAQYFGQNKVHYRTFDFQVPSISTYYYPARSARHGVT